MKVWLVQYLIMCRLFMITWNASHVWLVLARQRGQPFYSKNIWKNNLCQLKFYKSKVETPTCKQTRISLIKYNISSRLGLQKKCKWAKRSNLSDLSNSCMSRLEILQRKTKRKKMSKWGWLHQKTHQHIQ